MGRPSLAGKGKHKPQQEREISSHERNKQKKWVNVCVKYSYNRRIKEKQLDLNKCNIYKAHIKRK